LNKLKIKKLNRKKIKLEIKYLNLKLKMYGLSEKEGEKINIFH